LKKNETIISADMGDNHFFCSYTNRGRRPSIQVAQLVYEDGTLTCKRNEDFDFYMADEVNARLTSERKK